MSYNNSGQAKVYHVIGCMSGSSLDGLDLALCRFELNDEWQYECVATETIPYSADFSGRLLKAMNGSAHDAAKLHTELGAFIGQSAGQMALEHEVDLVASHGHTLFHEPEIGLTTQIGCGAHIAARSELPAVVDFRTADVAMDGQGAPLVPLGELVLFPDHRSFLNLGGITNLSTRQETVIGFDVCACNQILNDLSWLQGVDYDEDGNIARSGTVNEDLLQQLNELPFFRSSGPKSLGREWFQTSVRPILQSSEHSVPDKLATAVEHIAYQISSALSNLEIDKVMVTGGGAFNSFLLERIRAQCTTDLCIPDARTVSYKEAIIFAFLGLLRFLDQPNTLASVTGAEANTCGGAIYLPPSTI